MRESSEEGVVGCDKQPLLRLRLRVFIVLLSLDDSLLRVLLILVEDTRTWRNRHERVSQIIDNSDNVLQNNVGINKMHRQFKKKVGLAEFYGFTHLAKWTEQNHKRRFYSTNTKVNTDSKVSKEKQ